MKVFISYAREDRARMLVIAEAVRAAGHQVDVDEGIIVGGDDFARRIEASISACEASIVLWSPSSAAGEKPWVRAEASLALQKGKRVISVKLAECSVPLPFSAYHVLDLSRSSDLAPLLQSLIPAGAPPPVKAPVPPPARSRLPLGLVGAGVAVAVLSIGAWLAIPSLRAPPPAPPKVADAGPATVTPRPRPPPVVAPAVPDAGQPPAEKPKPKPSPPPPADPCAAVARSYEAIQDHCKDPCDLDHYPMQLDLAQCRACEQARTQLNHCRGNR